TAWFPQLAEWVRGVDLLYHEATYTEDMREQAVERFHSTAAQAAQVAREAGVGRLIVGHFSSRYKNADALLAEARAIFPETYAAQEGARFLVPLKKFTDTTVSK
ncbi:MAG: ribonuclease Z, partial [Bacteroidales bacterium]|nr:ribonuclease Z [Bacteroidales bacterium]